MSTYDGDPAVYPETVTVPDDGDNEDAGSVDVPLEALLDRTAWLKLRSDQTGRSRVMNWPYASGTFFGGGNCCYSAAYSPVVRRWIVACKSTNTDGAFYSSPDGHEWTMRNSALSSLSSVTGPTAMCCVPTNTAPLAVAVGGPYSSGGTTMIYKCTLGASSFFDLGPTQGCIGATAALFFNGLYLFFGPGLTASAIANPDDGIVLSSATALNAGAFTTTRIATAVSTGDGVGVPWIAACSGALVVAYSQKVGVSIPAATSTNGTTWTPHTDATLAASCIVFALAWDEVRSLFVRVTGNPATFVSKVWTSPDGVAWTLVSTLANDQLRAIACLGGEWVASGKPGGIDVSQSEVYRSSDAGASWYSAPARHAINGGAFFGSPGDRQRILASDHQFLLTTDVYETYGSLAKGVDYGVLT